MLEAQSKSPPLTLLRRETLNLGCGEKHLANAINVDSQSDTNPDVAHNLNDKPWPFSHNQFREVIAFDVIEHLDDFITTMEEIHRIAQNGAIVRITVPHFSCANAYTDPTHRQLFGYFSFDYVTGDSDLQHYTRVRFRKHHRQIIFQPSLLNKLVLRLANRYPAAYEQRWAWIFPAWYLYFELEVQKTP